MSGPGSGSGLSNTAPPPNKRLKLGDSADTLSCDQQLWKLESELPDELASASLSTCDSSSLTNNGSLLPGTNVTLINPSIPISLGISSSANVVNSTSATTSVTSLPSSLPAQNHQLSQLLQNKTQPPCNVSVQPQKMIPTTIQQQQILGGMVQGARPGPQNQLRYGHPPNIQQQQQPQQPHMQLITSQYVSHQNFGSPLYSYVDCLYLL